MLKSAGGVQGIAESILPGLVFLVAFTITRDLTLALIAALAAAAAFTVARLVQRRPLTQALAGIAGVGISAWLANTTGKAEDFYVLGFFTNAAYIAGDGRSPSRSAGPLPGCCSASSGTRAWNGARTPPGSGPTAWAPG